MATIKVLSNVMQWDLRSIDLAITLGWKRKKKEILFSPITKAPLQHNLKKVK